MELNMNAIQEKVVKGVTDELEEWMVNDLDEYAKKQIDAVINSKITNSIEQLIKEKMDSVIEQHLDTEFYTVGSYGAKQGPFTLRNKIGELIKEQCEYKPKSWSNEENAFTRAIRDTADKKLLSFKNEFNKVVENQFIKDAFDYATNQLKKRMQI